MGTNIGQYAPVFLPGEPPSLTQMPGRPQSTRPQRVGDYRSNPASIDARLFLVCGSSAPGRVEREGGVAAWLVGTLAVPSVQGHRLSLPQELWPYQSLFLSLLKLAIRRPLWPILLSTWCCQNPCRPSSYTTSTPGSHRGKPRSSRAASGANPSGQPTCRDGNKTTVEIQKQSG